jgi:hypothetical protein
VNSLDLDAKLSLDKHTKIFEDLKSLILDPEILHKDYANIIICKDYKILRFIIVFRYFADI